MNEPSIKTRCCGRICKLSHRKNRTGENKANKTINNKTNKQKNPTLILHAQAFLWSSKNCRDPMAVEKKRSADSVWQVDFETQVKER